MKKSFIDCPYGCKDGDKPLKLTVSGSSMHVKVKHPDKYEEFKKKFAEIKKSAVILDTATRAPPAGGAEPPKVEDKDKPEVKPADPEDTKDKDKGKGDDKPKEGKSFLAEYDEWYDSPKF